MRAYLDLDPAFTQLWHAAEGVDMRFDAHTHFVTVADAIGAPGSPIPDCGRDWIPTLPPGRARRVAGRPSGSSAGR